MNKDKLIKILLERHKNAEPHLMDLAFKHNEKRYARKDYHEGYKFALLEMQRVIESIKEVYFNSPNVDRVFLNSMKAKPKN